MSARSPRGSFSGASSEEVAADFGESLKDLQANNRYEISNLTIIAKENTEHAQAISEVLQQHIKTTAPPRKLPAFYVLDSIVKNVGTPYTVYFGRNLYQTFMEAYTLVDGTTRRNMEAMLKTWKEPVPGAMDPRPVFQPETVRPIENALFKARTAALQRGQQPTRNTPTPPQFNGQFHAPPGYPQMPPPQYAHDGQHPIPQQSQHYQVPPLHQPPFQYPPPFQPPSNDLESIKSDLRSIISRTQAEFAGNVYNHAVQHRLKALLDLQTILNTQQLDQASLQAIKAQVSQLASIAPATPQQQASQPAVSTPQWQSPAPASYNATPQQSLPFMRPSSAQPQMATVAPPSSVPSAAGQPPALAPAQIASLQALFANGQKPSTPQLRNAAPALQNASHGQLNAMQSQVSSAPQPSGADLLASLARSGLLPPQPPQPAPSAPPPSNTSTTAPAAPAINLDLLASLAKSLTPSSAPPTNNLPSTSTPNPLVHTAQSSTKPGLPLTAASLKQPLNPALLRQLYDDQPNQCSTCARRFRATDAGRAKKQRHLDWHFRVSMRLADGSLARGSHRSWFPDEVAWIQQREFDVSTATADEAAAGSLSGSSNAAVGGGSGSGVSGSRNQGPQHSRRPEDQFVRAPPGMIVNKCSICQEDMKASHPADKDDWVFVNAARYGGNRIVHATCLAEIQAGQQQQQQQGSLAAALSAQGQGNSERERSATPDSLLGKRKAEGVMAGLGVRVRRE